MCTEKDNEELVEALVKAARTAFLSLKETIKEHFITMYLYSIRACIHIFQHGHTKRWKIQSLNRKYRMKKRAVGNGIAQILPMLCMDMTNFLVK